MESMCYSFASRQLAYLCGDLSGGRSRAAPGAPCEERKAGLRCAVARGDGVSKQTSRAGIRFTWPQQCPAVIYRQLTLHDLPETEARAALSHDCFMLLIKVRKDLVTHP